MHISSIYLDILITVIDVIRARPMPQYRNVRIKVRETHKGPQDCLSLCPWSLAETGGKNDQHENNPLPGKGRSLTKGKKRSERSN